MRTEHWVALSIFIGLIIIIVVWATIVSVKRAGRALAQAKEEGVIGHSDIVFEGTFNHTKSVGIENVYTTTPGRWGSDSMKWGRHFTAAVNQERILFLTSVYERDERWVFERAEIKEIAVKSGWRLKFSIYLKDESILSGIGRIKEKRDASEVARILESYNQL